MKRWIALILVLAVLGTMPVTAAEASGSCGPQAQWSFSGGVLTISGQGTVDDIEETEPWAAYVPQIRSLVIGEGIRDLGYGLLSSDYVLLTEIFLPSTVEEVWGAHLTVPPALEKIHVQNNPRFRDVDGVLFEGTTLRGYPVGRKAKSYTVPADTLAIADSAFHFCKNLETVVLPQGLRDIGDSAFLSCEALRQANLPASLEHLGDDAFLGTQLYLNLMDKNPQLLYLDNWVVDRQDTPADVTLRPGTVGLADRVFSSIYGLRSVTLPQGFRYLGEAQFQYCSGLEEVHLPEGIETIPVYCFSSSSLQEITLPESLKKLEYSAFSYCTGLTRVRIPGGVRTFEGDVFDECPNLTELIYGGPRPVWEENQITVGFYDEQMVHVTFENGDGISGTEGNMTWSLEKGELRISCQGPMPDYDSNEGLPPWSRYLGEISRIILEPGVTYIGENAFRSTGIEEVLLPESLENIGENAFWGCRNLRKLTLPASLEHFSGNAFYGCTRLEELVLPPENQAFTLIDGVLFTKDGRTLLFYPGGRPGETYEAPAGMREIADYAFGSCEALRALGLPRGLELLGAENFYSSYHLTDLYFEGTMAQWEDLIPYLRLNQTVHTDWEPGSPLTARPVPEATSNGAAQNYWVQSQEIYSHLLPLEGGGFERLEAMDQALLVETYDSQGKLLPGKRTIPYELPLYGGVHRGTDGTYYLVCGQDNEQEQDTAEVIRVIHYSRDWERLGSASLYGRENMTRPFDAGSLRFAETEDSIHVVTARELYADEYGVHHQTNFAFTIHKSGLHVERAWFNHVSHSFNQFICVDGSKIITLDHGDAYPRAMSLYIQTGVGPSVCLSFLPMIGGIGQNETGASLGGLEVTDSTYLAAGNSIVQEPGTSFDAQRNIFLAAVPKTAGEDTQVQLQWLTDYTDGVEVSTPQTVQVAGNRTMILWNENYDTLCWCLVDELAQRVTPIYRQAQVMLSDCKPIIMEGAVCWYAASLGAPVFYKISLAHPEKVTGRCGGHIYEIRSTTGSCGQAGTITEVCLSCGETRTRATKALGHDWLLVDIEPARDGQPGYKSAHCSRCLEARRIPLSWREYMPLSPHQRFQDVPESAWYYEYITYVNNYGLMNGISTRIFGPEKNLTRAQLAQILYNKEGRPPVSGPSGFTDVTQNQWFCPAVTWAAEKGYVGGYGNGLFGPDNPITREQLALILHRYGGEPEARGSLEGFFDADQLSPWAVDSFRWAIGEGIISGKGLGRLDPRGKATRAQVAKMIMCYVENVEKQQAHQS